MKERIDRLQKKIEKLVIKHEEFKSVNFQLNEQLVNLDYQLDLQKKNIQELKEKNKILKLSVSLQGDGQDAQSAKKKINELVREIDKCIALLNA